MRLHEWVVVRCTSVRTANSRSNVYPIRCGGLLSESLQLIQLATLAVFCLGGYTSWVESEHWVSLDALRLTESAMFVAVDFCDVDLVLHMLGQLRP